MSDLPKAPNSRILRHGRISEPYACYSITKNVEGRRRILTSPEIAGILMNSWDYLRKEERIKLLSFCIMPDHYHLLFVLLQSHTLSEVLNSTNKFTARQINRHRGTCGRVWQDGFYDRRCRNQDEVEELTKYIEHNPVRQALVESSEQWIFSSAYLGSEWLLDRGWYAANH